MKKVRIVGAGPAGLFAAYSLAGKAEVTLIDQGEEVKKRKCPSLDECVRCGICDKRKGIGGAGLFSDGKLIFETLLGNRTVGSNLFEIIGQKNEREYLIKTKKIFEKYLGQIKRPSQRIYNEAYKISKIAAVNDMDYIFTLQTHVGTDKLPELIGSIEKELKKNGVNIITKEKITEIDESKIYSEKTDYPYDFLILAPGRGGATWLERVLKKNEVEYDYRAVDIGFRIETDAKVLSELVKIARDVKFSFRAPNGDLIRTFCVCPNGVVTRETYEEGFNLVNGASNSKSQSENTNFALLVSVPLMHRANCNSYADAIAKVIYLAGTDKPVLQRLGDIENWKRSKEEKKFEWRVEPTLKDTLVGDVGIGMPYRIERSLLWGIKKLSVPGLMEGLDQASTLVYAPEIKRYGLKVKTDEYLQTTKNGIYVAGDGSGFSRGIGGAAASGLLAAEGILKKL